MVARMAMMRYEKSSIIKLLLRKTNRRISAKRAHPEEIELLERGKYVETDSVKQENTRENTREMRNLAACLELL